MAMIPFEWTDLGSRMVVQQKSSSELRLHSKWMFSASHGRFYTPKREPVCAMSPFRSAGTAKFKGEDVSIEVKLNICSGLDKCNLMTSFLYPLAQGFASLPAAPTSLSRTI